MVIAMGDQVRAGVSVFGDAPAPAPVAEAVSSVPPAAADSRDASVAAPASFPASFPPPCVASFAAPFPSSFP